jgi:hypothetical protein
MDSTTITPLHPARDQHKLAGLIASLRTGWTGRPLVVVDCGETLQALTGSHRLAAAVVVGCDVPVVVIDATTHLTGWDGTCGQCQGDCLVAALLEARDDDERAKIAQQYIGGDIAALLSAEAAGD